jgi:hypothetical protein
MKFFHKNDTKGESEPVPIKRFLSGNEKHTNRTTTLCDTSLRSPQGSPTSPKTGIRTTTIFSRLKSTLGEIKPVQPVQQEKVKHVRKQSVSCSSIDGIKQLQIQIAQLDNQDEVNVEVNTISPREGSDRNSTDLTKAPLTPAIETRKRSNVIFRAASNPETVKMQLAKKQLEDIYPNSADMDEIEKNAQINDSNSSNENEVQSSEHEKQDVTQVASTETRSDSVTSTESIPSSVTSPENTPRSDNTPVTAKKPKTKKNSGLTWRELILASNQGIIEDEILIAPSVSLKSLIDKCKSDHKYGYLTVDQLFQFGLRYAFEGTCNLMSKYN